jgi:hypothetical protein
MSSLFQVSKDKNWLDTCLKEASTSIQKCLALLGGKYQRAFLLDKKASTLVPSTMRIILLSPLPEVGTAQCTVYTHPYSSYLFILITRETMPPSPT